MRLVRAPAATQGAAVTAAYGVMPASMAVNASVTDGDATMPALLDLDAEQCRRSRLRVDDAPRKPRGRAWPGRATRPCRLFRVMVRAAWAADRLVMSPHNAADPTAGVVPEDLLGSTVVHAGRPVLVPPVGDEADAPPVPC